LTNAQIIALPTTGVDIVPAAGAGKLIQWLTCGYVLDTQAGGYGGDVPGTSWSLQLGGNLVSGLVLPSLVPGLFYGRVPPEAYEAAAFPDIIIAYGSLEFSEMVNQPLQIQDFYSPGGGNYTLGNAANTLKITTLYTIIDV